MLMTPEHESWDEFCERLGGPEGCDFQEKGWKCKGGTDKTFATAILKKYYPDVDVPATLAYFEDNGGYCDCEILFNVDK